MHPMTIDELVESLADEALRPAISEAVQSWRAEPRPVATLFMRIRELVRESPETFPARDWHDFEDSVRRHSTVFAPYELARLFGLASRFEAATYEGRRSLIQQLRLDCDFPEAELRALEEQRRLDSLTPEQRQQHDSDQARERQRRMAIMQQVMQVQQGDAHVSGTQARIRAGLPRKLLDRASLEQLRNLVRSRGVDLASEQALDLQADDVEQAVQFARLLSHDRRCDLFRGQPVDWNPVPGILRSSIEQQLSQDRWKSFSIWAAAQPALAEIVKFPKKLAAIAQHYGVPTYLLDFSRNPRVAAFFATHTEVPPSDGLGCIYCLASGALDEAHHHAPAFMRYYEITPQTERVEVDGLFRMQAQEGSFVYANQANWTSFFRLDVIRFQRTEPVASPLPGDIYPKTQSEIERLVADYFSNEPESMPVVKATPSPHGQASTPPNLACDKDGLPQPLPENLHMATAKKASTKRSPAKKAPGKKSPAKKAPSKKAPSKKAPASKSVSAKKTSAPAKTRAPKGKVWEYIKKNGLQDKVKKTTINADAKLKP